MIQVKILGYHPAQRFAVRQTITAAKRLLEKDHPEVIIDISEVKDWQHIEHYTPVLSAPSLVLNENLVCTGRFPSRQEVLDWLTRVIEAEQG